MTSAFWTRKTRINEVSEFPSRDQQLTSKHWSHTLIEWWEPVETNESCCGPSRNWTPKQTEQSGGGGGIDWLIDRSLITTGWYSVTIWFSRNPSDGAKLDGAMHYSASLRLPFTAPLTDSLTVCESRFFLFYLFFFFSGSKRSWETGATVVQRGVSCK